MKLFPSHSVGSMGWQIQSDRGLLLQVIGFGEAFILLDYLEKNKKIYPTRFFLNLELWIRE